MAKRIKLTKGKYAIVDDEDYPYLNRFSWQYNKGVSTMINGLRGNFWCPVGFTMGQFLIKLKSGEAIIFKNKNNLDYRKENLIVKRSGVRRHRGRKASGCSSEYVGVFKRIVKGDWLAYITKDHKRYRLGLFDSEREAALARNKKARELYGELAYQNKID